MPVPDKKNLRHLNAVIFDYGDVLCLRPTAEDVEGSARILGISADVFQELWGRNRDLYDRGDLAAETYWRKFANDAGATLDQAQLEELSRRDVVMWSRLNPDMIEWLLALSSVGVKTAVLSNMHMDMVLHARRSFQWLDHVSCATFSAEVRLIKPEPAIYEHCLRGLGVSPTDCLFIDDREVNIAAARAMGIHAVQFQSMGQLRSELERLGFPTLPSDTSLNTRSA